MLGNVRNTANLLQIFRGIRTNTILREIKPTGTNTTSGSRPGKDRILDINAYKPTAWEKRVLVWSRTFPNKESIPETISHDTMQTAMSRGRIRCANYMMIITVLGCIYVVVRGKQHVAEATKDAETEHNDFRRQITAEYRAMKADEAKK